MTAMKDEALLDAFSLWDAPHVAAALIGGDTVAVIGDTDRVFELKSVTKLLSTYAFLVAVEEGVFELDTIIRGDATVEHLLSHAGGVGFAKGDPERAPEERRVYSSFGFELLAGYLEKETGMAFGDYAKEAVFAPLGMADTFIYGSPGHEGRSTVSDLTRFATEILNPVLLAEATVADAFRVRFPELKGIVPGYGSFNPCPWGLGFEIKGEKQQHWTGRNLPADVGGHFGVAGTYLWVHRPTQRAMVALGDRDFGPWAKPVWEKINDAAWAYLESC